MTAITETNTIGIQALNANESSLLRKRIKSLFDITKNVTVVGETENGVEIPQLIRKKEPDPVILDIRMPGMNGIEVLNKIRELKLNVMVCMLTNFPYPQYKKSCLEAGADYFLNKTEEFDDINIVIPGLTNIKEIG